MSSSLRLLSAGVFALTLPAAAFAAPWVPLTIHTRDDLTAIDFSDPTHGILGGTSGALFRTDDGVQWDALEPPLAETWNVVRRLSPDVMLVARNSFRRTVDAGKTWDAVPSLPDGVAIFDILKTNDAQLFLLRGLDVWSSSDAGATWQPAYDGADTQPFTRLLRQVSADTLVALGGRSYDGHSSAHVLRSINGGQSWEFLLPSIGNILAGDFADTTNGIVATLDGSLWRTTDAGASFDPITNDLPAALVIDDLRADHGRWIAATNDGTVFTSVDDGHHWKPERSDVLGNAINAINVQYVPSLVGAGGTALNDDGIFLGQFEYDPSSK